jgi:hypothetical protein
MTEMRAKIELKILDLDCFKEFVDALAKWAEETKAKENMSDAERALFNAALKPNK